jgi:NAD-dependent deacetylase
MNKPKVVVFSGAGLSKESGIPTFRDGKDSLWENCKVEDVSSTEGWEADPEVVLNFYRDRWVNMKGAEPNAAHKALARLEEKFDVLHVTQNIDDLLERAGCTNVRHLHGDVNHRKCEWHKSITMLDGDRIYHCDYLAEQTEPVKLGDRCPKCGGQLRPHVVWFGEAVDMGDVELLPPVTEIFIVVGTSAQVHPAATLLWRFKECPELYFIDPTPAPRLRSYSRFEGTAADKVPLLVDDLLTLTPEERRYRHQQRIGGS